MTTFNLCERILQSPTAEKCSTIKIDRMMKGNINEQAITKWASPMFSELKRGIALNLCRLSKAERLNRHKSTSASALGRVHRLLGRSSHLFELRWKLLSLKSRNCWTQPQEDQFYQSLRPVPVCADALWPGKPVRILSTVNKLYIFLLEVAVRSSST